MTGYNTIAFHADKCTASDGCTACMTACAQIKAGSDDLAHSRIQVSTDALTKSAELAMCRQCGDPKCVMNCPAAALTKDDATGMVPWDGDKCVNCLLCTVGCAYGGITYNATVGHVAKCDMCEGADAGPACVSACPNGALEYMTAGEIFNDYGNKEDLFVPGLSACQGCNSELLIRHSMRKVGSNVVLATPPGCIPGMGTVGYNGQTGTKVPVFHPLLTNTASMLAGVKKYYKKVGRDDVLVMALAGDGGTADTGFASISGAAERNDPLLYICVDNEGYMNTGMQSSGATSYGSWTSTTPVGEKLQGKTGDAKNLPMVMMMHNCSYVATASLAFMDDYYEKLEHAIEAAKTGMAYLHVYAPCPSGWRFPAANTIEVCRQIVQSNLATLWEYTPETGLEFSRSIDKPTSLREYLALSGKYKHLSDDQIAHIQQKLDSTVAVLKNFQMGKPEV